MLKFSFKERSSEYGMQNELWGRRKQEEKWGKSGNTAVVKPQRRMKVAWARLEGEEQKQTLTGKSVDQKGRICWYKQWAKEECGQPQGLGPEQLGEYL